MIKEIVAVLVKHPQVSYLRIIENRTVVEIRFLGLDFSYFCPKLNKKSKTLELYLDRECKKSSCYKEQLKESYSTEVIKGEEVWSFWSLESILNK